MFKKYFTLFIAVAAIQTCAFADDAVFSNIESEPTQFTIEPANFEKIENISTTPETPIVESGAKTVGESNAQVISPSNSAFSNENYSNAINSLDNAAVEIREQMSNYEVLMNQAKLEYNQKKEEYANYKKQYNAYKKNMKNVQDSKKKIMQNVGTTTK